jgi:hypothetical protein
MPNCPNRSGSFRSLFGSPVVGTNEWVVSIVSLAQHVGRANVMTYFCTVAPYRSIVCINQCFLYDDKLVLSSLVFSFTPSSIRHEFVPWKQISLHPRRHCIHVFPITSIIFLTCSFVLRWLRVLCSYFSHDFILIIVHVAFILHWREVVFISSSTSKVTTLDIADSVQCVKTRMVESGMPI